MINSRSTFIIDISKEPNQVKIYGYEQLDSQTVTAHQYEYVKVNDKEIDETNQEINRLLNTANNAGIVNNDILTKLESAGLILYNQIFSDLIKQKLNSTTSTDLILLIDDLMVDIPWELLHTGESFLCLKFNLGRKVRIRQPLTGIKSRKISKPPSMLILANPKGDLKSAAIEGSAIQDRLDTKKHPILIEEKANSITLSDVHNKMRHYDIIHYAGHSDYDKNSPDQSGWLLKDSKFTATEIMKMKGAAIMPSLVFSNSCNSGKADEWRISKNCGKQINGMAASFLVTGVRHYIGTFWEILDKPSSDFAVAFYEFLSDKKPIGEALRLARQSLIKQYGMERIVWASYLLYGEPGFYYHWPEDKEKNKTIPSDENNKKKTDSLNHELPRSNYRTVNETKIKLPTFSIIILIITLLLSFIVGANYFYHIKNKPMSVVDQKNSDSINDLVTTLAKRYRAGKIDNQKAFENTWTSHPLIISFLPLTIKGFPKPEGVEVNVIANIINVLKETGRIKFVDRILIKNLLQELNLSAVNLQNNEEAVKIGKLVGARFFASGVLIFDETSMMLSITLIETETSNIILKSYESIESINSINKKDIDMLATKTGQIIETDLLLLFPLRGRIVEIENKQAKIDIGKKVGLKEKTKLYVLKDESKIGQLEVAKVNKKFAYCNILSQQNDFVKGLNVEEIPDHHKN